MFVCSCCGERFANAWGMYKVENGEVINRLFTPEHIPNGWHDSPVAAKQSKVNKAEKPKRVRRTKAQIEADKLGGLDGNSSRDNQQFGEISGDSSE